MHKIPRMTARMAPPTWIHDQLQQLKIQLRSEPVGLLGLEDQLRTPNGKKSGAVMAGVGHAGTGLGMALIGILVRVTITAMMGVAVVMMRIWAVHVGMHVPLVALRTTW